MAVSPEDLAAGTLALQVFVKNAKNVEIIVDVAFGVIPSVLGIGAAGLLGSGIINTAKEVRNSISLLKTFGPGLIHGGYGLNLLRKKYGEKWMQSSNPVLKGFGIALTPIQWIKSRRKGKDTQDKKDDPDGGGGGGGGGGNPPNPPEIKSSSKENENNKTEKPRPLQPSYGFSDSLLVSLFKRDNKQK
jgi:hypothetical protein